jgi:hypothetical protein
LLDAWEKRKVASKIINDVSNRKHVLRTRWKQRQIRARSYASRDATHGSASQPEL